MDRKLIWHMRILGLCAVATLATALGCKQCASPYDYCPPTFTGPDCGVPCDARYRAGSILDGSCMYGDGTYLGDGEYEGTIDGEYEEMPVDTTSTDGDVYDESGQAAEMQLTAEESYTYETPEYARRPPRLLNR